MDVLFSNEDGTVIGTDQLLPTAPVVSRDDCRPGTMITLFAEDHVIVHSGIDPFVQVKTRFDDPVSRLGSLEASLSNVPAGNEAYELLTGCGGVRGLLPVTELPPVGIVDRCVGDSPNTIDVLASAGPRSGVPSTYSWATDLPFVEPGPATHTFDSWQSAQSVDMSVTHVPNELRSMGLQLDIARNGLIYPGFFKTAPNSGDLVSTSAAIPPSGFATSTRLAGFASFDDNSSVSFARWQPPGEPPALDFRDLPPRVVGIEMTEPMPGRKQLQAHLEGDMPMADLVAYSVTWTSGADGAAGTYVYIGPATSEAVLMPEIPEEQAHYLMPDDARIDERSAFFLDVDEHSYRDIVESGTMTPFEYVRHYYTIVSEGVGSMTTRARFPGAD